MPALRMTLQTQLVLRALLDEPSKQRYGLELCDLVGLPSGTIYPILARFEQVGWVDSAWEDPAAHEAAGRPRRRFYRLTSDGAEQARAALARAHRPRTQPSLGWSLAQPDAGGAQA
jgi:PadR family transcriptional regulator, regulatory protein PadR